MGPFYIDGEWVTLMGKPYKMTDLYPGVRPGGLASFARTHPVPRLDPAEATRRTTWSKIYWAAFRIAQKEKYELMGREPPSWLVKRKARGRQWMPGEHKKPKKATTAKEQSTTAKGTNTSKKANGQGELDL